MRGNVSLPTIARPTGRESKFLCMNNVDRGEEGDATLAS